VHLWKRLASGRFEELRQSFKKKARRGDRYQWVAPQREIRIPVAQPPATGALPVTEPADETEELDWDDDYDAIQRKAQPAAAPSGSHVTPATAKTQSLMDLDDNDSDTESVY
jgi:hypothetical protein